MPIRQWAVELCSSPSGHKCFTHEQHGVVPDGWKQGHLGKSL